MKVIIARSAERHPSIGLRGLRKRAVGADLIFHRIDVVVNVVRILHAARDWPSMLDDA